MARPQPRKSQRMDARRTDVGSIARLPETPHRASDACGIAAGGICRQHSFTLRTATQHQSTLHHSVQHNSTPLSTDRRSALDGTRGLQGCASWGGACGTARPVYLLMMMTLSRCGTAVGSDGRHMPCPIHTYTYIYLYIYIYIYLYICVYICDKCIYMYTYTYIYTYTYYRSICKYE